MLIVSVRVFSKILDSDIFVRYDSVNLSDYRHFSRIWSILRVDGISMYIMALQWALGRVNGYKACQWAQGRASGHKGLSVGTRACQWTHTPVSGHKGVPVGTRGCQWVNGPVSGHTDA